MTGLTIHDRLTPINHSTGRGGHVVRALVMHVTDGETAAGCISWFHSPSSKVSAHYVCDRDGTLYRCVRESDTAWANGILNRPNLANPIVASWVYDGVNPNSETISIECVGLAAWGWTAAQVGVVDLLNRDIASRHGLTVNPTTIIGHRDIDSVNRKRCPPLTEAQWARLRLPLVAVTEDEQLERMYQAERAMLGEKRYKGWYLRPYYEGSVLWCDRGVVAPTAEATQRLRQGLMDDASTVWTNAGWTGILE